MKRFVVALVVALLWVSTPVFAQGTQTRTPSLITLQPTVVSGVAATTVTRQTTTGLTACKTLDVLLNITTTGTATGALTIFVEDSADGGLTWDDVISSNSFALGASIVTQRFFVNGYLTSSATSGSAAATETLVAGTTRQGPFGDRFRVREKMTGPSGSPVGATYTITAVCKQ